MICDFERYLNVFLLSLAILKSKQFKFQHDEKENKLYVKELTEKEIIINNMSG